MRLDAVFVNGRFHTLDPERPTARSVGVLGGVVAGFDEELDGCRADVAYDLGGAPAVPGFDDAHYHLSLRGQQLLRCDVSPSAVRDLDELYAALARRADRVAPDAWLLASGYDDSKLGGRPTIEALDAASHGRPLWMVHCSHHGGMVNTAAIRRMGYADPRDLPDVAGGLVERDGDGNPTGFLAELAVRLVNEHVRPEPFGDFLDALAAGSAEALELGLTSVTEPGICGALTGNGPTDLAAYQAARDGDALGVRVTVMPEIAALHDVPGGAADGPDFGLDLGLRTGLGDDRLRIGAVKIFSDGALSARTAAMSRDYADRPGIRGFLREDAAALRQQIVAAHRAGWQVATHAIGDVAVSTVLDAYEEALRRHPRQDPRHRIEHCAIADDATVRRIRDIGAIPVPQGRFIAANGDAYVKAVGEERAAMLYRQRSFVDAGIEVPGSSDCPVVDGSPLHGIAALVSRTPPDGRVVGPAERLTVRQALRAFTYGSAYANHQESRKGTLSHGKLADFTVLSDDIFALPPDHIGDLAVQATVVGGVVRYGDDAVAAK